MRTAEQKERYNRNRREKRRLKREEAQSAAEKERLRRERKTKLQKERRKKKRQAAAAMAEEPPSPVRTPDFQGRLRDMKTLGEMILDESEQNRMTGTIFADKYGSLHLQGMKEFRLGIEQISNNFRQGFEQASNNLRQGFMGFTESQATVSQVALRTLGSLPAPHT